LLKSNQATYVDNHWDCFFSNVLKFYETSESIIITVTPDDKYVLDCVILKHYGIIPLIINSSDDFFRNEKFRATLRTKKHSDFLAASKVEVSPESLK